MRRRVHSLSTGVLLAALALLLVPPAFAQQAAAPPTTAVSFSARSAEIGELLQQGYRLEIERRWSEALTYYEDAIRQYPNERALQQRFESTRLHYDVGRRYSDGSYLGTLSELPLEQALDLYAQVLLKIQAHYVAVPNWKELVQRGSNSLEVALSEPAFVQRNAPGCDRRAIIEFCQELRRVSGPQVVESRYAAREAVAAAARLAERLLQISPTAVVLEYLCGATNTLDPYSAYLTPNQLSEVYSQIEGNFVGLGVELKMEGGALKIVRVIGGSPAEQGGIRAGDHITAIDGRSVGKLSTDQAANLLQGEADSVVELAVAAPGQPPRTLQIRRRRVEVPSVENVRILDAKQGIGYLQLTCFQKTTCRDLDTALWKLHREGMRSLIIDIRGNPGGLLVTAVEVADKFVERGIIVSTRGRSVQEDFTYSAHAAGTWRMPLVVLIDQDSASAAEIFAGAIRDHRRGTIVGVRSYGKGSVQGIFPLSLSNAGIRLTTAKFYSPAGRPFSRIGVEPDMLVRLTARPVDGQIVAAADDGDDAMLSAALKAAGGPQPPR